LIRLNAKLDMVIQQQKDEEAKSKDGGRSQSSK